MRWNRTLDAWLVCVPFAGIMWFATEDFDATAMLTHALGIATGIGIAFGGYLVFWWLPVKAWYGWQARLYRNKYHRH